MAVIYATFYSITYGSAQNERMRHADLQRASAQLAGQIIDRLCATSRPRVFSG